MLDSIKAELEANETLLEDFPEAVYPIHCLEGIANRLARQTHTGARTLITWTAKSDRHADHPWLACQRRCDPCGRDHGAASRDEAQEG